MAGWMDGERSHSQPTIHRESIDTQRDTTGEEFFLSKCTRAKVVAHHIIAAVKQPVSISTTRKSRRSNELLAGRTTLWELDIIIIALLAAHPSSG